MPNKQTIKLCLQNFKKMFGPCRYHIENTKKRANSVETDEVAHYEPPQLDLCCLKIQLFSYLQT